MADPESMEIWGKLSYADFVTSWNSPSELIPIVPILAGGLTAAGAQSQIIPVIPDPGDVSGLLTALGTLLVAGCAAAVNALVQAEPFDFASAEKRYFDWSKVSRDAIDAVKRLIPLVSFSIALFRGTALKRVYDRMGLYDNRLWVFRESHFFEAVGYAQRDGMINNDTAAIAVYGMIQQVFNSLIASGNIRIRFAIEYGLDGTAQAFLVGPVVFPIPDMRHG
ncbi:MAG: hypothetical protein IT322_06165 [Anaerolineae bacterium]|nr:hypothetical protein [Anaerolineae bacterium]